MGRNTDKRVKKLADAIHYPQCWDTAVYPTLLSALQEIGCSEHKEITSTTKESGVMVVKDGKAWGVDYAGGGVTCYGWIPLNKAKISDPQYCKKVTDVTWENSPYIKELKTGKLVHIEKITTVKLLEG